MTNRTLKIGGALLALVMLIIIGAIVFINNLPEVADQLKSNASPVIVTLTQPLNGSTWERNLSIPIKASASPFTSVASIELWVDGTPTETLTSKTGSAEWVAVLQTEGEHTFFVRAIDKQSRVANSNVVRVIASHTTDPGATLLQPVKGGDTVASLAANFNTTPQDIIDLNPGLDPNSALPPGNPIKIPIQPPALSLVNNPTSPVPSGPTQPGSNKPPGKFAFWVSQFFSPKAPPAPDLALQVNQCAVNLFITPKSKLSQSTNVYRFDAATNVFIKIATLADSNGNPIGYSDPDRNGNVLYYVSAFNAAGESPSNIVSADITDPVCLTPFWIGVKFSQTPLKLKQSVGLNPDIIPTKYDQAYFYLSINNSGSIRVPADPNAFITHMPDGYFIPDEQIKNFVKPAAEDLAVEIDAWGWSAGQLLHIGTFQRTVPALKQNTTLPADYTASQLLLCDIPTSHCEKEGLSSYVTEAYSSDYLGWGFRWLPDPSNADHGLWQVSVSAFPNDCAVNPPDLIATGQIDAASGHYSFFFIDFALLKDKLPNVG
ncbi:MAG TPA: Ig-like domain-containing protein, partial [Anaerolineae bacterium]|nr:Ig-like domain-containing protein [Anaerolineae bacterium]